MLVIASLLVLVAVVAVVAKRTDRRAFDRRMAQSDAIVAESRRARGA